MSQNHLLPRVFISCVSDEFRALRSRVADAVRVIGWEPVTMENWATGDGELIDWHRRQIASCQGLIQIAGIAYGAEPPRHDRDAHGIPGAPARYSYTQFEFLHSIETKRKTWLILPGPDCTRDTPADLLDLPKDSATGLPDLAIPGAREHQRERRRLQASYIGSIKQANHLRHAAANDDQIEILILKLKDLPAEFRDDFEHWQDGIGEQLGRIEQKTDDQTLQLERMETMLAALVAAKEEQTREFQQLGLRIEDIPQAEIEADLARRLAIPVETLRASIAAGLKSADALTRSRAELLAGQRDEAIATAEEVKRHHADAIRQLIAADEIIGQAHYEKGAYLPALAARQRIAAFIDPDAEPLAWADAQHHVALLMIHLARHTEAVNLLSHVIAIKEGEPILDAPSLASSLNNLASALKAQGKLSEAEPLIRRALGIDGAVFGSNHPTFAARLINLGALLKAQGKLEEAKSLIRHALKIGKATLGTNHPFVGSALNNLAGLLQAQGFLARAERLFRLALKMGEAALGDAHPEIAIRLNNLGTVLEAQSKLVEAELVHRRACHIAEVTLGSEHPSFAIKLGNHAVVLLRLGDSAAAEHLFRRALGIGESTLGDNHPDVATWLSNLAGLLLVQGRHAEVVPLIRRTLLIIFRHRKFNGTPFRHEGTAVQNFFFLRREMGQREEQIAAEIREIKREAGLAE